MSILYFILVLFACAASGMAGAFGMRFVTERNREIAEQEDPRDTKIRDLQARAKLIDDDRTREREKAESATEHVDLAHQRIYELIDQNKNLTRSLENQEALKDHNNDEMELLRDKLSLATKQLDTMRQRNQELEVELSVINEPDMLATNDIDGHGKIDTHDEDPDEDEVDPFTPAVPDNSPSLIHALTDELDRWKRHCHVLGDELKTQRSRLHEVEEIADSATSTIQEIDELTDIRGIGAVLARKLHKLGIYNYETLLNLSDDDLERARQLIPDFERRMARDNWIEQARMLQSSKHCETLDQAEFSART